MRLRENGLKVIEERDRAKNARKAAKEAQIASDQAFIDKITEKKGTAKCVVYSSCRNNIRWDLQFYGKETSTAF